MHLDQLAEIRLSLTTGLSLFDGFMTISLWSKFIWMNLIQKPR